MQKNMGDWNFAAISAVKLSPVVRAAPSARALAYGLITARSRLQVSSSHSGSTRVSPVTVRKFVSPDQRGTI